MYHDKHSAGFVLHHPPRHAKPSGHSAMMRAACAFLALELAGRTGNFVALLRLVRALTLVSEILLHVEVNSVVISLHAEDSIRKDYLTTRLFSLCV